MARASIVTVLGGAALLLAACARRDLVGTAPGSIGSGQPSTRLRPVPALRRPRAPLPPSSPGSPCSRPSPA